ncbi:hypothetical protein Tco_1120754 [Tanacetum coccineum]
MEFDIKEDENETELTYPYEEVNPLNPPPPASESELEDVIEVENTIEHEDETVLASVHEVGESSTAPFLLEDSDGLFLGLMRRDINSLFDRIVNVWSQDGTCIVHSSVEQGMAAMEKLVEKLGNAEEKAECKKFKKELEEERLSNTFLRMQNKQVKRDLYWTRVQAHEFYQEMIHRIMPLKFTPLTQDAIRRMIKESVDAAIAVERARHANAGNDARGSRPARGQDAAPTIRECTFAGFMKCNPTAFHGTEGAVKLRRWFKKTKSVFRISKCAEGKKVKFAAATLQGPALT